MKEIKQNNVEPKTIEKITCGEFSTVINNNKTFGSSGSPLIHQEIRGTSFQHQQELSEYPNLGLEFGYCAGAFRRGSKDKLQCFHHEDMLLGSAEEYLESLYCPGGKLSELLSKKARKVLYFWRGISSYYPDAFKKCEVHSGTSPEHFVLHTRRDISKKIISKFRESSNNGSK